MMASVLLDVTFDRSVETLADVLHGLRSGLNVTFDAVDVSAGDGWPKVEFTGSPTHLGALVARYAGDDLVQLGAVLEMIKE